MLPFLPFRTLRLSSPPTPAGGAAPLSAATSSSSGPGSGASPLPEFEIPYDLVHEVPRSAGQVRWDNFVVKNKQNPFIVLGASSDLRNLCGGRRERAGAAAAAARRTSSPRKTSEG